MKVSCSAIFVRRVLVLSLCGLLTGAAAARTDDKKTCGSNFPFQLYDVNTQLCCGNKISSRFDDDKQIQACCRREGSPDTLYPKYKKICCENLLVDLYEKDGERSYERECLNNRIYMPEKGEIVCHTEKLIKKSLSTSCCGSSMYEPNEQRCCSFHGDDKLYSIIPNKTHCCALELYNSRELTCDEDRGILYPISDTKICGDTSYNPTKEVCCMDIEKVLNRTSFSNYDTDLLNKDNIACHKGGLYDMDKFKFYKGGNQYQSQMIPIGRLPCGNSSYFSEIEHCCSGNVYKKSEHINSMCCGSQTFSPGTEICCNDMVINKAETNKFCCDNVLYEKGKKDDQQRYKRSPHEFTNCCGIQPYNRDKEVCCEFQSSLREPILKTKKTDTKCCPITFSNATSYNEFEEKCIKGIGPCPISAVPTTPTILHDMPRPQSSTPTALVPQTVDCPYCENRKIKSIQIKKTCNKKNEYNIKVKKITNKGRGVMLKVLFRADKNVKPIVIRIRMKFDCKCFKKNNHYVIYTNRDYSKKVRKHGKPYNLLRLKKRDLILKDSKSLQRFRKKLCSPKRRNG